MIPTTFNPMPTGAKARFNPLFLSLLAGGLASSLCAQTPATAQTPVGVIKGHETNWIGEHHPMGEMVQKMHERHLVQFDQQQAALKKQLNLTPAQEPLWETFIQTVRPLAPVKPPFDRAQMREIAQLPAPQRAQKMLALHEAQHDAMLVQVKSHIEGMSVFYAQLSAEQQKTFDQVTLKHQRGMMHSGHLMHPGPMMHPEAMMPPKL